jgi:polysaccharide export outer membrane protein
MSNVRQNGEPVRANRLSFLVSGARTIEGQPSKEQSVKTQRSYMMLFAIAGVMALSAPALPQGQNPPEATQMTQTASARPPADRPEGVNPAAKVGKDYLIGADDVLDVSVWKEQELTRTLQVRPDGKISMPLLGDVQAAGLTPGQLAQTVSERLKKYLTAPQVTVILTQINSQRVYVIGEVTRPGAYAVLPGMTILQAISSAGGLTQFANGKKIFLMRDENHIQAKHPFSYKEVLDGRKAEENLTVKAGDTIVVP